MPLEGGYQVTHPVWLECVSNLLHSGLSVPRRQKWQQHSPHRCRQLNNICQRSALCLRSFTGPRQEYFSSFCLAAGSGQGHGASGTNNLTIEPDTPALICIWNRKKQSNEGCSEANKSSKRSYKCFSTTPTTIVYLFYFDNLYSMGLLYFFVSCNVRPDSSALARELPHFLFLLPSQEESRVALQWPATTRL